MFRPSGFKPDVPLLADVRLHRVVVPALLLFTAFRAVTSLRSDSVTFDEPFHLVAGVNAWRNADYRLSPDHPPLARMWAALPVLFMGYRWPEADNRAWVDADSATFAVDWLFGLNDGQRLVVAGRCMMVVLLLATCATVYALARTLFGPAAGLLALVLAALSPTLLAHGRLDDRLLGLSVRAQRHLFGLAVLKGDLHPGDLVSLRPHAGDQIGVGDADAIWRARASPSSRGCWFCRL